MKSIYTWLVLAALTITVPFTVLADEPSGSTSVTVQTIDTATKGFPCILKITVRGPGSVPIASLYDETALLRVRLTSVSDQKTYTISSSKGMEMVVTTPGGARRDDLAQEMWQVQLQKGESRSILVDLWSLRPELGRGTLLDDVPAGEYEVSVSLSGEAFSSNTVRLRLTSPVEEEERLLSHLKQKRASRRGRGVNWSKALREGMSIPQEEWNQLPEHTQKQVGFHMLLSELSSTKDYSATRQKVERMPLPDFLAPEKQCLQLEMDVHSGQNIDDEASRLMQQYPDLKWRLTKIKAGEGTLLRSPKITGGDTK